VPHRLTRLVWPATALIAVAILTFERLDVVSRWRRPPPGSVETEFRVWEKSALGAYKQVKKSYFLNGGLCKNVINVLNGMSTNQPRSNWVLSHTTASTFECLPATITPRDASQNLSDLSDDTSVETPTWKGSSIPSRTPRIPGATRATLDQQAKCADQARRAFADLGYGRKVMAGYQSHYDTRLNKCFIEVSNTDTQVSPGTIWTFRSVQDAFEGKQYGTYAWHTEKDKKYWEVAPFECEVLLPSGEQQFCTSDREFTMLIGIYMEDRE
jgi:hypothetical protein